MARAAFLFPGQGAQYVGMGRALCEALPAARALFQEASGVLGYDLLDVCVNGPAERLNSTAVSQPALFVAALAALESLGASDPDAKGQCAAAAGLSLGEYTALVFAGALSFRDGLRVVQRRGQAMQAAADAGAGAMVAILGLDRDKVEGLCATARGEGTLRLANLLCPGNVVVSDTVGFIRDLPHGLVAAFRATLEETVHADLLLHVVDASSPARDEQAQAVDTVLAEIPAGEAPRLLVWNKIDAAGLDSGVERDQYGRISRVFVSARTGAGLDGLRAAIAEFARERAAVRGAAAAQAQPQHPHSH